jgi:hypothetical protein
MEDFMTENEHSILQHDRTEINISESVIQSIDDFGQLVQKWNGLSLVARSTVDELWDWHFLEALSVVSLLKDYPYPIIDFGAGGGVLGIPLALAGVSNIHLVERSDNKLTFLRTIAKFKNSHEIMPFEASIKPKFDCQNLNQASESNLKNTNELEHSNISADELGSNKFALLIRGVDKIAPMLDIFQEHIRNGMVDQIILFKSYNVERELYYAGFNYDFEYRTFNRIGRAHGKIVILRDIQTI